MSPKAFIFDLNGTMVDDMQYHVKAWHRIFNELGAPISMERMKEECYGKNHEVIERILPSRFSEEEKGKMGLEKEKQYQREFKPHLTLVPGLNGFLEKARQHRVPMAIGSAAIMINIDFVLDNLGIRHYFNSLVSADDVAYSKPHPETYLECARQLNVEPQHCLVFEDAPKGVECALNAEMKSVVLTILHEKQDFDQYSNIIAFVKDFKDPQLLDLLVDNV